MRAIRDWSADPDCLADARHADELASETGAEAIESPEEARRRRRRHGDELTHAGSSAAGCGRAHVNAVGSSIASTRELDTATIADCALFVDRRESTVNEAGDYLMPLAEGAIPGPSTFARRSASS